MAPHHRPEASRLRIAHALRESLRRSPAADHTRSWPAWTNDMVVSDALPPCESAIVDAIGRMGRPVTAGELSVHSWQVKSLGTNERNDALRKLRERGVLEMQVAVKPHPLLKDSDPSSLTYFGFPEHFAELEANGR